LLRDSETVVEIPQAKNILMQFLQRGLLLEHSCFAQLTNILQQQRGWRALPSPHIKLPSQRTENIKRTTINRSSGFSVLLSPPGHRLPGLNIQTADTDSLL
jgi:hypothetical protein